MPRRILIPLALLALLQSSPVPLQALVWHAPDLQFIHPPGGLTALAPRMQADLQADGLLEDLSLREGQAAILSAGEVLWQSPPEWLVVQAQFNDLDANGLPEAVLLVWRPFQPWPVDEWLPNGGRITGFHDRAGDSCHLILIGWLAGRVQEVWAGSALADPLRSFAGADLDGDGQEELIALEGEYRTARRGVAGVIKLWEWNGFGFSSVSEVHGHFDKMLPVLAESGQIMILIP